MRDEGGVIVYVLKRLMTMVVTIWLIATLTFIIMKSIPGDPFASDANVLPEEVLQNIRAKYNLDKPLPIQYILYMKNLITFDLGPSIQSETRDVNTLIAEGFPISALLGLQALVMAIVFGLLLGIVAALNHRYRQEFCVM